MGFRHKSDSQEPFSLDVIC